MAPSTEVSIQQGLPESYPKKDMLQTHTNESVNSEELAQLGEVDDSHQGAFGHAADAGGKQFRVLGVWRTAFTFLHTEVGIGILSLPAVLKTLGLIPGLIAILVIGILATYTAYLYFQFWRRYKHINNLPDALAVLGGKVLSTIGGIGLIINLSFASASACLTMSVALNTLTGHSMCTVAFVGFAALVCYVLCIPRTMNFVAWFSGQFWSLPIDLCGFKLTCNSACHSRYYRSTFRCHRLSGSRQATKGA